MIWVKSGCRRGEPFLGATDAIVHFASLFLPALGLGAISAGLAKLLWRRELGTVPWTRLAAWSAAAAASVLVAGLVVFGHDGVMATYFGMIVASAAALMWAGFGARR
jgi:hypothetical protein